MKAAIASAVIPLALVVASAGCGNGEKQQARERQETERREQPYIAGSEDVARADIGQVVTGATISGELTSDERASVRAQIAGQVVEVNADVGNRVRKGDVIVRIRALSEREAVESARAALVTAKTELVIAQRDEERTETLVKAGALAQRDLEQAEAAVANAKARVAQAQASLAAAAEQLRDAVARAPISGTISAIPVSRGDVVGVGAELFTVIDLSTMQLEASVPSDYLESVRVGTPVQFRVQGYGDRTFTGRITRISPAVDPNTNQIRVYATIPNEAGNLVSGLYAEGRLATGQREALILPSDAVTMQGGDAYVMVVDEGRAIRQQVELGERDEQTGTVQIVSGLQPGEIVLTGPAREVREGAPIQIRGTAEQQTGDSAAPRPGVQETGTRGGDPGTTENPSSGSFPAPAPDSQPAPRPGTTAPQPRRSGQINGRLSGRIGDTGANTSSSQGRGK